MQVIENFTSDPLQGWSFYNGGEFPGASGNISYLQSINSLKLSYDLTKGVYVAAKKILTTPIVGNLLQITFQANLDCGLVLRVTDNTGQVLQYYISCPLEFRLNQSVKTIVDLTTPYDAWGGTNNWKVNGGIKEVWILATKIDKTTTGSIVVQDLRIVDSFDQTYNIIGDSTILSKPLVPNTQFGVCYHYSNFGVSPSLKYLPNIGANLLRIDIPWSNVEKQQGVYNFSGYDPIVNYCVANNLEILFILCYGNGLYDYTTQAGITAFANFATAATNYFANKPVKFEIWNEPDYNWQVKANPAQFTALCNAAISAMKQANTNVKVCSGGPSYFNIPFIMGMLNNNVNADTIGIHGYRSVGPETLGPDIHYVNYLTKKPMWMTETGYSSSSVGGDTKQANLAIRTLLSVIATGVPMFIWYDLINDGTDPNNGEHNFGLLYTDLTFKPAFNALKNFKDKTNGYSVVGLFNDTPVGLHVLKYQKSTYDKLYICWSSKGNFVVNIGTQTFNVNENADPIYIKELTSWASV